MPFNWPVSVARWISQGFQMRLLQAGFGQQRCSGLCIVLLYF